MDPRTMILIKTLITEQSKPGIAVRSEMSEAIKFGVRLSLHLKSYIPTQNI